MVIHFGKICSPSDRQEISYQLLQHWGLPLTFSVISQQGQAACCFTNPSAFPLDYNSAGLGITHGTRSNCRGAQRVCCGALCKVPIQIYIFPIECPSPEQNGRAPSREKIKAMLINTEPASRTAWKECRLVLGCFNYSILASGPQLKGEHCFSVNPGRCTPWLLRAYNK